MADQPERPIEKLLRECGKRRPPPNALELHPANRRLLQDEIARTYHRKEARVSWFGPRLLPKLAWGFCTALSVVALAVWLSVRSDRPTESDQTFARNEKILTPAAPANGLVRQKKTEAIPALQSNLFLADNLRTAAQEPVASTALNVPSTGPLLADGRTMVSMNLAEQELARDTAAKSEFAGAAPSVASVPTAPAGGVYRYGLASTAAALLKQTSPSTSVQNFVREVPKAGDGQQAQPILASFKFERTGSEIRIIDQDGSVYLGSLGAFQRQLLLRTARKDQPVAMDSARPITATETSSLPSAVTSPEEYTFHVAGTNRTLGGPVSFDGKWSILTNAAALTSASKEVNGGIALDRGIPAAATMGGRISGTAIIKGGTAIPINAVSQAP
jgi:hypothetical protein